MVELGSMPGYYASFTITMSEVAIRDEIGQWVKNNPWAYKKGVSGHPVRYMPAALERACQEYIETRKLDEKGLTWAGLAIYLGISTTALINYRHGKVGKTDAVKSAIVGVLDFFGTHIEDQLENSVDAKFRLVNTESERWKDTKHVEINKTEDMRLIVQIEPELAQKLAKTAGDSLNFIDGECETIVDGGCSED